MGDEGYRYVIHERDRIIQAIWMRPFEREPGQLIICQDCIANRWVCVLEVVTGLHSVQASSCTDRFISPCPGLHGIHEKFRFAGYECAHFLHQSIWPTLRRKGVGLFLVRFGFTCPTSTIYKRRLRVRYSSKARFASRSGPFLLAFTKSSRFADAKGCPTI
jgi:hypothetical protein